MMPMRLRGGHRGGSWSRGSVARWLNWLRSPLLVPAIAVPFAAGALTYFAGSHPAENVNLSARQTHATVATLSHTPRSRAEPGACTAAPEVARESSPPAAP